MSLNLRLTNTIDGVINTFITQVSTTYNIKESELRNLWDGKKTCKPKSPPTSSLKKEINVDSDKLLKCNKAELIALCKAKGYKCSGNKIELISRLMGKDESPTPKKASKSKKASEKKVPTVIKKLTAQIPDVIIRRNKFNNFEHPETGLVFDNDKNKKAIGTQNNDGSINELTEDDIDRCNAFKFKCDMPDNLDKKTSLEDVEVDELEEDDELDELGEDDEEEDGQVEEVGEDEDLEVEEVEELDDDGEDSEIEY